MRRRCPAQTVDDHVNRTDLSDPLSRRAAALLGWGSALVLAACSGTAGAPDSAVPPGEASTAPSVSSSAGRDQLAGVLPTQAEIRQARHDVGGLDLHRLAAQLVVPRQEGPGAAAAEVVRRSHVGGVVAFGNVIPQDPARIRPEVGAANDAVQQAIRADGRDWPAFVAIDQEGGSVNRIGAPLTPFPTPMALGAAGDTELTTRVGLVSGSQLRELGFTVVLAPSADVTAGAMDPTIGTRSPGSDPDHVTAVAGALLAGYRQAGVLATLKHFPGHGGVSADSHLEIARQPASMTVLRKRDLRPFAALAQSAPAVMVGHIELMAVDAANPSTLSKPVVTGLLRDAQKFGGVVVSDALEMQAITDRYGAGEAAVRAIDAGCDVLLIPADTDAAITALVSAVRSGRLPRERLQESATRMVAALRHAQASPPRAVSPETARATARALAAASTTQLSGPCGQRMVGPSISIAGGQAADRAALIAAARAGGLTVGSGTVVRLMSGVGYRAAGQAAAGDRIGGPVQGFTQLAASTGPAPNATDARPKEIVVALDRPYLLASSRAGVTLIATYGRTPATFEALVNVLLGKHKAGGRLPVPVGRYPIGAGCR